MNRIVLCIFLSPLINIVCQAQTSDTTQTKPATGPEFEERVSILLGYNFRSSHFAEIGIAKDDRGIILLPVGSAYYLSTEIKIDNETIIGPKIGAWMYVEPLIGLGANLIYYTDFHESSLRFRPEVGLGFNHLKIVYGYNVPLTNKDFEGINKHNFGLAFLVPVKKWGRIR